MTTLKKYKSRFEDIIIPEVNKDINPGNNFYQYVNDKWLKSTHIPDYESSFSVNEEIENIIEKDLFFIIDKCSKFAEKGEKVSSFTNILKDTVGRFALSSNRIKVQKNSIEFLKKITSTNHFSPNSKESSSALLSPSLSSPPIQTPC